MKNLFYIFLSITLLHPAYAKSKHSCPDKKQICIISHKKSSQQYNLIAINNTPYITSFHLDIEVDNMISTKTLPIKFILKGHSKDIVTQLKIKNHRRNSGFNILYGWMHGDIKAKKNNFAYRLPYKHKTSHHVGQGFNTENTHSGLNKYAIDWNMPIGTPIYAARSGYVIELKENSNATGKTKEFINMANYIKILHKDGSFATYAHLKQNGVVATKNQHVSKGTLIGYSGNTGYSTGPHLHFHIAKPYFDKNNMTELTIPFKFTNCKSQTPFIPKEGKKYQSC